MVTREEIRYVLCADIGGSHITTAVCNAATLAILPQSISRTDLMSKGSAEHILERWQYGVEQAMEKAAVKITGVGMAMPGPFDYANGISYIRGLSKYDALYGMDVKHFFANILNVETSSILLRNDAEATIAGEMMKGAGKEFTNIIGVTLGTGFGSAQFKNGISRDLNLGSEPFGKTISDDYLSTRWFLKRYFDLTGISVSGVQELAGIAYTNASAKGIFKEFALNMSNFLMEPVYHMQPEALIICGNIARASGLFLPHLKKRLNIEIRLGTLGEDAALIGAASLFTPALSTTSTSATL